MNRRDAIKTGVAAAAAVPLLQAAEWKPALFTRQQNETVIALVDQIIPATDTPGAKAAQVNRYMDLLLKDGPAVERERFMKGLSWFENEVQQKHKTTFSKLPPAQQNAFLTTLDTSEGEGNEFFRMAKSMTSRLYYQTEAGFKELNKHGVPKTWACAHGQQHAQ
jgi:hypothetical protein